MAEETREKNLEVKIIAYKAHNITRFIPLQEILEKGFTKFETRCDFEEGNNVYFAKIEYNSNIVYEGEERTGTNSGSKLRVYIPGREWEEKLDCLYQITEDIRRKTIDQAIKEGRLLE